MDKIFGSTYKKIVTPSFTKPPTKEYSCIQCKTNRYLIFPNGNDSYVICSACHNESCNDTHEK
jgi:hypothetical protein